MIYKLIFIESKYKIFLLIEGFQQLFLSDYIHQNSKNSLTPFILNPILISTN